MSTGWGHTAARSRTSTCWPMSGAAPVTSCARPARFAGDVVAAVAAPTRATAKAAVAAVEVEWEELPAVFDPVEAVAPGAPVLHPDAVASAREAVSIDVRPIPGTNACHRFLIRHGDAAAAMREADVVVEEVFRTPSAAHAPMEPHVTLAEWEGERLTL